MDAAKRAAELRPAVEGLVDAGLMERDKEDSLRPLVQPGEAEPFFDPDDEMIDVL